MERICPYILTKDRISEEVLTKIGYKTSQTSLSPTNVSKIDTGYVWSRSKQILSPDSKSLRFGLWLTKVQVGLGTKPSRRFLNFEDIESGLSAALSSTLSVFEHLCSMILLQISQVSNSADKGEILHRLRNRTSGFLSISTECSPESFGSCHIARQHVKVLERLAKHYDDSIEDAFEADDLRLDAAKLRDRYKLAPDGVELDETQIFQRMSERASDAFDAMKLQVHDRHFSNLFAKISPAFSAAHVALCFERPEVARSLLGSSPNTRSETDILGRQVSHLAAEIGDVSLLETPSTEARDIYHMTQLAVAANAGNVALFQTLVDQGYSLDSRDIEGRSILCIAAGAGSIEIVRFLLKRNVSPNPYHLSNSRYFSPTYTALHAAAAGGHAEVCKLLLKHGAFARWPFNDCTPSQEAINHNHQLVGQLLKDAEAEEGRHIEEAERATNINSTPDAMHNTTLPSQNSTTAPPMERSQTQLPVASAALSGRFTPMSAWSRKRSYAQSDAGSTPVDSSR